MLSLFDSSELDTIINQLDTLLMRGHGLNTTIFSDFKAKQQDPDFDLDQYIKGPEDLINSWYREVVEILDKKFMEKYYLFHFIKPRVPAGLGKMGVPEKVSNLWIIIEYHVYALEEVILRLEERQNLAIRKEIAEKEHQADILYQISYSDHTRVIKLNNIQLSNPNFDSKAANFFEYIYSQPNIPIEVAKIEEATAIKLSDNIHELLRDLGFTGAAREVFFPIATKNKVMFANPITKAYAIKNDLPVIDISKLARKSEK